MISTRMPLRVIGGRKQLVQFAGKVLRVAQRTRRRLRVQQSEICFRVANSLLPLGKAGRAAKAQPSGLDQSPQRAAPSPRQVHPPAQEGSAPAPYAHARRACAPRCRKSSRIGGAFISPAELQQIRQRKTAPWRTQNRQPRGAVGKICQSRAQSIQIANQRTIREPVGLHCAIVNSRCAQAPPPAPADEFASAPAPRSWRALHPAGVGMREFAPDALRQMLRLAGAISPWRIP